MTTNKPKLHVNVVPTAPHHSCHFYSRCNFCGVNGPRKLILIHRAQELNVLWFFPPTYVKLALNLNLCIFSIRTSFSVGTIKLQQALLSSSCSRGVTFSLLLVVFHCCSLWQRNSHRRQLSQHISKVRLHLCWNWITMSGSRSPLNHMHIKLFYKL